MIDQCPICMAPKPERECSQCGYEAGHGWEPRIEEQLNEYDQRHGIN